MSSFFCFVDGDKNKVVEILAKHCDEQSKLQQLKDKYKEKHDQVRKTLVLTRCSQ